MIPQTPRKPVVEAYGQREVVDPFRWMEALADPEVEAWARAQDEHARAWLDARPGRAEALARTRWLCSRPRRGEVRCAGGRLYFLERIGAAQPVLRADGPGGPILFDPASVDPSGRTAIDWYAPSPEGRVALGLSMMGSEQSALRVLDVDGGLLADRIPGLPHASIAWRGDGFFYARQRPHEAGPTGVLYHRLGGGDDALFFEGKPRARYQVQCDAHRVLIRESRFPEATLYLSEGDAFEPISELEGWPPVVLSTARHDARAHPSHALKMAAALQAAGCEALLTVEQEAGHGAGTPLETRIRGVVDRVIFLWSPPEDVPRARAVHVYP